MKSSKIFMLLVLLFIPLYVKADASNIESSIGNNVYLTLEEAVSAAKDGDTITLRKNVTLKHTLTINKDITINLNNKNITATEKVIKVENGNLKLTGKGIIEETTPNYYAVLLKGSPDPNETNYSSVTVGKDVTLKAWAPIFIDKLGNVTIDGRTTNHNDAYGVSAHIYGTLVGKTDPTGGAGCSIYINGSVKNKTNYPVIVIYDNATLESTGPAIYQAGYTKTTIHKANLTGVEAGIAIKSGILNLNGTNITATGPKQDPIASNNSVEPTGATIQIESNKNYAGNIQISIDNNKYTSKNSHVILEYLAPNTTITSVNSFIIKDGAFTSPNGISVFEVSTSFKDEMGKFVINGNFSSNVSEYTQTVSKEYDDKQSTNNSLPIIKTVFIVLIIATLLFIIFKLFIK